MLLPSKEVSRIYAKKCFAIMNYHVSSLKLKSKKPLPCIKKFPCVSWPLWK